MNEEYEIIGQNVYRISRTGQKTLRDGCEIIRQSKEQIERNGAEVQKLISEVNLSNGKRSDVSYHLAIIEGIQNDNKALKSLCDRLEGAGFCDMCASHRKHTITGNRVDDRFVHHRHCKNNKRRVM